MLKNLSTARRTTSSGVGEAAVDKRVIELQAKIEALQDAQTKEESTAVVQDVTDFLCKLVHQPCESDAVAQSIRKSAYEALFTRMRRSAEMDSPESKAGFLWRACAVLKAFGTEIAEQMMKELKGDYMKYRTMEQQQGQDHARAKQMKGIAKARVWLDHAILQDLCDDVLGEVRGDGDLLLLQAKLLQDVLAGWGPVSISYMQQMAVLEKQDPSLDGRLPRILCLGRAYEQALREMSIPLRKFVVEMGALHSDQAIARLQEAVLEQKRKVRDLEEELDRQKKPEAEDKQELISFDALAASAPEDADTLKDSVHEMPFGPAAAAAPPAPKVADAAAPAAPAAPLQQQAPLAMLPSMGSSQVSATSDLLSQLSMQSSVAPTPPAAAPQPAPFAPGAPPAPAAAPVPVPQADWLATAQAGAGGTMPVVPQHMAAPAPTPVATQADPWVTAYGQQTDPFATMLAPAPAPAPAPTMPMTAAAPAPVQPFGSVPVAQAAPAPQGGSWVSFD